MDGTMNMENFKTIMVLRETFAFNRQKDRIRIIGKQFGGSENLANLKQTHRLDYLKVNDTFKEKDFGRKIKLINASRK